MSLFVALLNIIKQNCSIFFHRIKISKNWQLIWPNCFWKSCNRWSIILFGNLPELVKIFRIFIGYRYIEESLSEYMNYWTQNKITKNLNILSRKLITKCVMQQKVDFVESFESFDGPVSTMNISEKFALSEEISILCREFQRISTLPLSMLNEVLFQICI